jgi:hypothetical protein
VKLMVGDKVMEKRVEVRLDPTISVPLPDLQAQFDLTLKLRDMQSAAVDALRSLDSIKEQLQQVQKALKDQATTVPEDITKQITDHMGQIESLAGNLTPPGDQATQDAQARSVPTSPKLVQRLGSLFGAVDGVNAAPTSPQKDYYKELEAEFRQRVGEVNRFIGDSVPKLNDVLRKQNMPTVVAGKPIDLPR